MRATRSQEQSTWGKMPQDHTKEFLEGAGAESGSKTSGIAVLLPPLD